MSRELSGAIPSMKPKLHVIVKDMFLTVRGFFIPFFMIGVCLTLSAAAISVTVLVMIILERWTMFDSASLHSVGIAIITGIAASGFISVVIEGGNNYHWNRRRQLILSNYLRTISSYEFNIQSECVHPLIQVCRYYHIKLDETKCCGLLDEENFDEEFEEEPELPNRFVMLAEEYSKLYPVLQEVYTNDKEYLKQREIDVLERLFNADQTIRRTYITELTYLCHEQQNGPKRTQWAVLHKLFPDSLERTALEVELEQEVAHFVDTMMQHTVLETILRAGTSGPSCVNARDWSFIVVRNRKKLIQMADANGSAAEPLKGAALGILVCGDLERAFAQAKEYWVIDCSIAAQNMTLVAQTLGIGSVWLGTWLQMERVERQR